MKRALAVAILASSLIAVTGPAHAVVHTATPVPGRFCKAADVGKKVKTAKHGVLTCKMDGDRARWKK